MAREYAIFYAREPGRRFSPTTNKLAVEARVAIGQFSTNQHKPITEKHGGRVFSKSRGKALRGNLNLRHDDDDLAARQQQRREHYGERYLEVHREVQREVHREVHREIL